MTADTYTPRRASPQPPTPRFQPRGKRAADDQLSDTQALLVDLEQLAVEMTARGSHGWADRIRDIARRHA